MEAVGLLVDAFGRVRDTVHSAVGGLTGEQLNARLDPGANSIAWLVWNPTRVQDDHVAAVAGARAGLDRRRAGRVALRSPSPDTGHRVRAQGSADVGAVRVDDPLCCSACYTTPSHEETRAYLRGPERRGSRPRRGRVCGTRPVTLGGPSGLRRQRRPPARGPGRVRPRRAQQGGGRHPRHTRGRPRTLCRPVARLPVSGSTASPTGWPPSSSVSRPAAGHRIGRATRHPV